MSFDLLELSRHGGRPMQLWRIARGTDVRLYTSANRPITIGVDTYLPLPIMRSSLRDSTESRQNNVTLTLPVDASCASWFRPYPPGIRVDVTLMAKHWGDDEVVTEWIGRVVAPGYTDSEMTLTCEPSRSSGRARGRHLRILRGCTKSLYDSLCGVVRALHETAIPSFTQDGLTLTAAEFNIATGLSFAGGYFVWEDAVGVEDFRTINSHTGTSIVLNYGADFTGATNFRAYPGCRHNKADCALLGNSPRYGGFSELPVKNPFNGNPP